MKFLIENILYRFYSIVRIDKFIYVFNEFNNRNVGFFIESYFFFTFFIDIVYKEIYFK